MRWRLGRSSATACFKRKSTALADAVVATAADPGDTMSSNAAADARSQRVEGPSDPVAMEAIVPRGDNGGEHCCATADSCLRFSGRSGNGESADCVGRPHVRDSLSSSFKSFVENLGSRPRPSRTWLPEATERMSGSTGTGHDDAGDTIKRESCAKSAASIASSTVLPLIGGKNDENEEGAAAGPSSSLLAPCKK